MIRRSLLAFFFVEMFASAGAQSTRADPLVLRPELPVDGPAVLSPLLDTRSAKVAFDGTDHLVVWSDPRGGVGDSDLDSSIFAARVTTGGTLVDPIGLTISDGSGSFQDQTGLAKGHPAIAFDGTQLPRRLDGCAYARRAGLRRARNPGGPGARPGRVPGLDDPIDLTVPPPAPSENRIPPWRSTARASWWPGATRAGR